MTPLNILIAYPYCSARYLSIVDSLGSSIRFVLDSGAFTSWKLGKEIRLDDYCKFIETLPVKPWRYFTLDVIGDPEATMKNYQTMLRRGFNPVPIFTRGEDPSVLDDYYETSDVVGVGGLVGTEGNRGFVKGIMDKIGERRVHWLGFTHLEFLKHFRPYMCDTSAWESVARYGQLRLYMGRGKFTTLIKKDFANKPDEEVLSRIRSLGIDPYKLAKEEHWRGSYSTARELAAYNSVSLSMDVEKNIGTKYFLAVAAICGFNLVARAYRDFTKGRSNG